MDRRKLAPADTANNASPRLGLHSSGLSGVHSWRYGRAERDAALSQLQPQHHETVASRSCGLGSSNRGGGSTPAEGNPALGGHGSGIGGAMGGGIAGSGIGTGGGGRGRSVGSGCRKKGPVGGDSERGGCEGRSDLR
ncbi:hypothetical protein CLOM_g16195 [Closterium sp. NIES-68]|nr:hypothetical protein CLOM_g16195 [Closterium sp. NIES-68]